MYYSQKYSEAEEGAYVTQLLSCVESRTLTDAIKNLSSKELLRAVRKFGEYDPAHSGVISQARDERLLLLTRADYTHMYMYGTHPI